MPKPLAPSGGDSDSNDNDVGEERDAGKFVTLSFACVSSLSSLSPQCHFLSKMAVTWLYSVSQSSPP
jgi:hypothetical protein